MPPEHTWKHVEIFPGSGERTLEHSKSHFESLTSRTCPEPPNWSPVAVVDGHMMHTATAVQHNVDVQSLDGAPSGVLRDGEIQNSLLCSPAEVGTPTRTWKSLVVDPLREIFPGCDSLAAHGVVESLPTHQSGFTGMMEFAGLWQSTTPELHNRDSLLPRTSSMARSMRTTVGA